ncbi:YlxR family protein [Thermasporomyces composti]|uniref:YlxR family protein n=1 Tax=Thermasporomyces composti TaxID=696763 RepID=UPI000E281846|nr:YlxR family protein [Thermasporomyces composti]
MCVGCRHRTDKSELLRVVLVRDGDAAWVLPDASGRAPGRGAHVHPTRECFGLAERRRAFPRALRAEGPVDLEVLRRYIAARDVEGQGATTTRQPDRPALVPNASPDEGDTRRRVTPEQESGSSGS